MGGRFFAVWGAPSGARVTLGGVTQVANGDGWAGFSLAPQPDALMVIVDADGYRPYTQTVAVAADTRDLSIGDVPQTSPHPIRLPPLERIDLPRLHADGLDVVDDTGARWFMRGTSEHRLLDRFLRGDVAPVLADRAALGFNCVRVFGMKAPDPVPDPFALTPQTIPDFSARVAELADRCAAHRLYLWFVCFCDAQSVMPTLADQQAHYARVWDALRPKPNVLFQLGNENFKNGFDAAQFPKPEGLFASSGSAGAGADWPIQPWWDWCDHHAGRDWWRFPIQTADVWWVQHGWGKQEFTGTRRPTFVGETRHLETMTMEQIFKTGAGMRYGCGGNAHLDQTMDSVVLTDDRRALVQAFLQGLGT